MIARASYIRSDNDVRFVLDQHAELDRYNASLMKQQSVGRHAFPPLIKTYLTITI
jgi:hypothetical protein